MTAVATSSPRVGNIAFQDQNGSKDHSLLSQVNGTKIESAPTFENDTQLDGFPADEELPEPICGGCKKLIDEESADAGVIHFATQLWHVDCFRCAKCKNPVTTDRDDILLLSDGHPICGQCNYSCQICNLPIMEEAIMTGDESYHASCFVCRSCRTPIAELVFAKTSQGIYCMKCHNQRVARSRRHAEKKRAAAAAAASSGNGIVPNTPDLAKTPTTPAGKLDARSPSLTSQNLPGSPYNDVSTDKPALPPKNENSLSGSNSNSNLSPYMQNNSTFNLPRPNSAGQGSKRPLHAPIPDSIRSNGRRDRPATAESSSSDLANLTETSTSGSLTRSNAVKLAQQSTLAKLEGGSNTVDSASPLLTSAFEHAASSDKSKKMAERNKVGRNSPGRLENEHKTKNFAGLKIHTDSRDSTNESASRLDASSPNHENDDDIGDSTNDALIPVQYKRASRLDVKEKLNANSSLPKSPSKESRLSRAFSFYDPDIIGLMESFGKFDSYEEFSLDVEGSAAKQKKQQEEELRKADEPSSEPNTEKVEKLNNEHVERDAVKKSESKKGKDDPSASLTKLSETMRKSIRRAHDGHVDMDTNVMESMLDELESTRDRMKTLQRKYERIRRASQQAAQGFSSAREEYEQEVQARYDAEAEMLNLKRQLHLQATKLAGVATEKDKHETLQRRNTEVKSSIKDMEKDLGRLQTERDLVLAEVMGLQDIRKAGHNNQEESVKRGMMSRFDGVKEKYQREIQELTSQRDALLTEIEELRQSRDVFAEETTALNARNEELNSTLALLQRRVEHLQASEQLTAASNRIDLPASLPSTARTNHGAFGFGFGGNKNFKPSLSANSTPIVADSMASSSYQNSYMPDSVEHLAIAAPIPVTKVETAPRKFKWMKAPKLTTESARQAGHHIASALPGVSPPVPPKSGNANSSSSSFSTHQQHSTDGQNSATSSTISHHHKHSQEMGGGINLANGSSMNATSSGEIVVKEHLFQPFNVIRPVRCFACQKNMWGQSELKCQFCGQACHVRCLQNLPISCNQPFSRSDDTANETQGPPIFGRGLCDHLQEVEHGMRKVPLVVEKCVETVEMQGMDYEGIYRKSGGTSQLKIIQQLFEKGQPFNLNDRDRFNDISAITSALKNYFRELPEPLLTFELHEKFIECVEAKNMDVGEKHTQMRELVHDLPREHFDTLKFLIDHLYRVRERSEENRMNSRNLGVVFGPTLMRSHDPALEFAHMGGKAMTIEFMIDHPDIFE